MAEVKYYLESENITKTQVTPIFSGVFTFLRRSGQLYYVHECKDKMKFIADDYTLTQLHKDDICEDITVLVETGCGDEFKLYWKGSFKLFAATTVADKYVEVKPEPTGAYECYENAVKVKQSPFVISPLSYVTVHGGHGSREIIECVSPKKFWFETNGEFGGAVISPFPSEENFTDSDYPLGCVESQQGFEIIAREIHITVDETRVDETTQSTYGYAEYVLLTRLIRWTVDTDCINGIATPPNYPSGYEVKDLVSGEIVSPLDEWLLISDDCAEVGKATFKSLGSTLAPYKRGRIFKDFLSDMIESLGCGFAVVSNFFNLNADGTAPDNVAYQYAEDFLKDLTIHQKSDIKRKEASNPSGALAWEFIPEKLIKDFSKLFNVYVDIIDDVVYIEHYSYFARGTGWDLSDLNINTKTDNSGNESIKTENFAYSDRLSSAAFKATEISYNCGDKNKDNNCELISTDAGFIENINNESEVKDEGFVIISNTVRDGQYVMNDSNAPLRWSALLENLHLHGRPFKSGNLNGLQQDFLSWRPYIKAEGFTVPFCCDDVLDVTDKIVTKLGLGEIQSAEHNIIKDTIKPKLFY